jgi:hypothetical protein
MSGPSYRCDACRDKPERCTECRARRQAVVRTRRARWRKAGKCVMCGRPRAVVDGVRLQRCQDCRTYNAERSLAAHVKRIRALRERGKCIVCGSKAAVRDGVPRSRCKRCA